MVMSKKYVLLSALCLTMLGVASFDSFGGPTEWINFMLAKKNAGQPFQLKELQGLFNDIPMPANIKEKFLNVTINLTKFLETGKIIQVSATALLGNTPVVVNINVTSSIGGVSALLYYVEIEIPDGVNFKALLPELGFITDIMTKLRLGKSFLIFSNYDYTHNILEKTINKGVNIGAVVEFGNLLTDAKKLLDTVTKGFTNFIMLERLTAIFRATLDPFNLASSYAGVDLPLRLGIDFTAQPLNCKNCYIQKIYSSHFGAKISADLKEAITGSLTMELKDVKNPLSATVTCVFDPIKEAIRFEGFTQGDYYPAFGLNFLHLGPFGFAVGLMSEPPWISSLGIRAGYSLGSVIQGVDGMMNVDLTNGGVMFSYNLKKFDLDQLIVLSIEMIDNLKNVVNMNAVKKVVPPMEMSDLKVEYIPTAGIYFGTTYPLEGLRMSLGEIRIGRFAGGGEVFVKGPKEALKTLAGSGDPKSLFIARIEGHLFPFEIKIGKATLLKISGQSKITVNDKTTENCAQFFFDMSSDGLGVKLFHDVLFNFLITADVEIPILRFKQHTYIMFDILKGFTLEASTSLGEDIFSGSVKISFDVLDPKNFSFDMRFEQKFIEHIKAKVIRKIAEDLAKIFEIRSASIHSSGKEITEGKVATISLDMTIFGQDITIKDLTFDFSKIDDIAQAIVDKILDMSAFHVNVANDTIYPIEAKCSKAGIWPNDAVTILPGENKRAEAGGADWGNGLKVTIKGKKDMNLSAGFGPARPGNVDARVVMVPKFKIDKSGFVLGQPQTIKYSIENTSFGVGIEFDISGEEISQTCR